VPTTTLHLTRHAEQRREPAATADDPGADLTPAGVRQAHRLGARLAHVRFGVLRHGPLPRTARTARLLAGHLPGVPVEETDLLQDRTPSRPAPTPGAGWA
jgi:serine/threonine-protein phosphatase PGAM5